TSTAASAAACSSGSRGPRRPEREEALPAPGAVTTGAPTPVREDPDPPPCAPALGPPPTARPRRLVGRVQDVCSRQEVAHGNDRDPGRAGRAGALGRQRLQPHHPAGEPLRERLEPDRRPAQA